MSSAIILLVFLLFTNAACICGLQREKDRSRFVRFFFHFKDDKILSRYYCLWLVQSIVHPTEYTQRARLSVQSSELGHPTPSPASECCPTRESKGGDTLACGGGGGGTQFRRRDRHSGTLCIQ